MKKLQLVMAHPDDEIIFGIPMSSILICSSDENNPDREWCRDRKKALMEVGEYLGVPVKCLDYNSEFYRLPTRDETLKKMAQEILDNTEDEVYTHNPWGEYGHLDHILMHQILAHKKIYYSDILIENNWLPVKRHSLGEKVCEIERDMKVYEDCKKIYNKYGVWTWDRQPVKKFNVYTSHRS